MSAEITLDDLGVPTRSSALLDAAHVARVAATLDADAPGDGDVLPSLWHWAFFTPTTPTAGLGPDGHPRLASPAMAPFPRRMWGAGRLEWHHDLHVGAIAERVSTVRSARTTTGASGTLLLVVVDHEYHQDGVLCVGEQQTLVYRDPPAEPVPLPVDSPAAEPPYGAWSMPRRSEPTLLFRFSAITFNTHRIHYDLAYARDVEGYPGLVVQGPLTAMRVAAFVERSTARRLTSYEFKATAPMFAGLRSTIVVAPPAPDGTGTAEVLRNDGAVSMSVDYRLGDEVMARCFLYVPGHRADRFAKAVASGTDAVILDLEDAVPVAAKDNARRDVRAFLESLAPGPVEAWVRINDGERGRADLRMLAGTPSLAGVVVPKATPDVLAARHADAPDVAIIALVESAIALTGVATIAASPGVLTLAIGEVDLAADLGFGDDVPDAALWALRMQVVVVGAAAGRGAPLGPVIRDIEDLDRFAATVRQLRHAGFGAVQAIHPKQVGIVNAELTPTADELAAAERLLEAAARVDGGVFVDDAGRMIDEAVLRSARRTLGRVTARSG